MKKSDLFKIGVLLMATTLGTTGCSFGEDEKKPEIVVDPAEKTIEYYIAGKVTEGTTALSGVEVKAGEVTATTDAEGAYKLTVDSKKVYTVTFSKEGYMSIDNATATIADNAANRSMVSLSVKLSKKAPEKEVKADAEEEVVVTDKGDSNISQAEAAEIIPPKAIETTTTVSVTPYEEPAAVTTTVTPGNNVETPVAIANIEVETAQEVTLAKPVTLAIIQRSKMWKCTIRKQPQGPEKTGTKWQMPFMTRKRTAISSHCPQAHHCPENIRCASRVARPQEKNW